MAPGVRRSKSQIVGFSSPFGDHSCPAGPGPSLWLRAFVVRKAKSLASRRPSATTPVLPDPALRYGSGRSSFEKPNRWLLVAFGDHSCPAGPGPALWLRAFVVRKAKSLASRRLRRPLLTPSPLAARAREASTVHILLRCHAPFPVWPLSKNSPCREQSGSGALGQCLVK